MKIIGLLLGVLVFVFVGCESNKSTSADAVINGVKIFKSDSLTRVRYSNESLVKEGVYNPSKIRKINKDSEFDLIPHGFNVDGEDLTFQLKLEQSKLWKELAISEASLFHVDKKYVYKGFLGKPASPDSVFSAVYIISESVNFSYALIIDNMNDSLKRNEVLVSISDLETITGEKVFPDCLIVDSPNKPFIQLNDNVRKVRNKLNYAFDKLSNNIDETVRSFESANNTFYKIIEKYDSISGWNEGLNKKVMKIKHLSRLVVNLLGRYKMDICKRTGGFDEDNIPLGKDDQVFGLEYLSKENRGDSIVILISEFRDFLVSYLEKYNDSKAEDLVAKYKVLLNTDSQPNPIDPDGSEVGFIHRLSANIPLAAVVANLTLWQSYVKNAEANYVGYIAAELDVRY